MHAVTNPLMFAYNYWACVKATKQDIHLETLWCAKLWVSLTAPNCDHFERVSLMVLDNFLDAIAKAKKLIRESIAQNLMPVSLTKSF